VVTITAIDDAAVEDVQWTSLRASIDAATTDTTGYALLDAQTLAEVMVTDNEVGTILMFQAAGGTFNGNIGGRLGADAKCAASTAAVATCGYRTKVHAFLTVSLTDQVQSMPASFGLAASAPITSLSGAAFATDWMAMFVGDGTSTGWPNQIPYSLADAGILPASTLFWSGTYNNSPTGFSNDAVIPYTTCYSFTSSATGGINYGATGNSSKKDVAWISDATYSGNSLTWNGKYCNTLYRVLCVCGR
jgi:hypothetical protein